MGWLDAAQSASSMPHSLGVYCFCVSRRSGWDLVQSRVTPEGGVLEDDGGPLGEMVIRLGALIVEELSF